MLFVAEPALKDKGMVRFHCAPTFEVPEVKAVLSSLNTPNKLTDTLGRIRKEKGRFEILLLTKLSASPAFSAGHIWSPDFLTSSITNGTIRQPSLLIRHIRSPDFLTSSVTNETVNPKAMQTNRITVMSPQMMTHYWIVCQECLTEDTMINNRQSNRNSTRVELASLYWNSTTTENDGGCDDDDDVDDDDDDVGGKKAILRRELLLPT
ncbi:hypothetical protein PoB_007455900 [Plakobranchus ocellatus]|uniref:Uncharacterized protein n=1 Tax=Plakobranchus ocellatus TaxID=259542 RepID=A0AAV4DUY6_9GAST|nr:hypothetical protein PoB_007455900 [Plakobranchus ocellatus]